MINTTINPKTLSFKQNPRIIQVAGEDVKLEKIHNRLNEVVHDLGGIEAEKKEYQRLNPGKNIGIIETVYLAKSRSDKLETEIKQHYGARPDMLQHKLGEIAKVKKVLEKLETAAKLEFKQVESPTLIDPSAPKGFHGNSLGILLPDGIEKESQLIKADVGTLHAYTGIYDTVVEMKNALSPLEKPDWDFETFNKKDAKLYSSLKDQILTSDMTDILRAQLGDIKSKIAEIKDSPTMHDPSLNVDVFSAEDTGRLLALETAKLRRENLTNSIQLVSDLSILSNGGTDDLSAVKDNLKKPDLLARSLPDGDIAYYTMSKDYAPTNDEIFEALSLNQAFQPILDEKVKDGVDVFFVPGMKAGIENRLAEGIVDMSGKKPEIWLNSYNPMEKYTAYASDASVQHLSRENEDFKPAVLTGNDERARNLANKLGQVVAEKIIAETEKQVGSSLILQAGDFDFLSGWKTYREGTDTLDTLAEDIRIAFTEKMIPASSSETGTYDQSELGENAYKEAIEYTRGCLKEHKSPSAFLMDHFKSL